MLKEMQALFAYHSQAAMQSLNALCRRPLANLMTVMVIATALIVPTLLWVLTENAEQFLSGWDRSGRITLYLNTSLSEPDQKWVLEKVTHSSGVGDALLKSPEQGLKELSQQEGMQDALQYLKDNPLPAVIEVVPAVTVDSPEKLEILAGQLKALAKVDQAKVDLEWLNRLRIILGFLDEAAVALVLILAFAVVVIVGTTLRLAIHTRQEEIQILKLIGASESYILRSFLYSGMWYGFLGALIAVLLVNLLMLALGSALNRLALMYSMHYPLHGLSFGQILDLVLFATLLGWVGALLSVKRELVFIEPYN